MPTHRSHVKRYTTKAGEISIHFRNLTLGIPRTEDALIERSNLEIKQGEKIALVGANGSGKSSLFRVNRGLWSRGDGEIETCAPEGTDVFCASQNPRFPDKPLNGILSYPYTDSLFTPDEYERVLCEVDLPKLTGHLPWNALQPDALFEKYKKLTAARLRPFIEKISDKNLQGFLEDFYSHFN